MKRLIILFFIFAQTSIATAGPAFNFSCEDRDVYWTDNYTKTHFKVTGQLEQMTTEVFMLNQLNIMINANNGELEENVSGKKILNNVNYKPRLHTGYVQFDIRPLKFKNIFGAVKILLPRKINKEFYITFIMDGIDDHEGSSVGISCVKAL